MEDGSFTRDRIQGKGKQLTEREKYILAIDLGTSGPKTALISKYGDVLACEFEATPVLLSPGGGAEQDAEGWWKAVMTTAKKVLAQSRVRAEDILAVSVTSQWSGTVAVDSLGRPLMKAIIWMDCRGAEAMSEFLKGMIRISGYPLFKLLTWLRLTGGAPARSGKDSLSHILWIKKNRPEVYRETFKFLDPKDFINLCLTGRFAATFDSILLYWVTDNRHPDRIAYSDRLIKTAGLRREKLPDLIQAMDILGPLKKEVALELGLLPSIPVIGGTPDVHSAGIGSGAVRDYEGHLYIGNSSWISAPVPFKKTDLGHNFGSFPSPISGRYLILSEQESAGKCLAWLSENIFPPWPEPKDGGEVTEVYWLMDRIVAEVPAGANGVIFTPWLYGERTPVEDPCIRSSFFNLSLENTRADMVRAVFEGIALNARWLLNPIEAFMKRPFPSLNFIGGGANSDPWAQILADVLDRKIRQVKDPIYANVRGAAFLAFMALNILKMEDIPRAVRIKAEYFPEPVRHKLYDELFSEFVRHYRSQKKICERLNKTIRK
ncbi:MAG: FGGY-family carbohydrate kinase [Thermodesulfobacteriota bacterium]